MSRRAVLALLGTGAIGAGSAYGTGAFDVVEGRRPFDIASVDDGSAFLEIQISDGIGSGDDVTLLTLTNRFDSRLDDVDVSIASSSSSVDASNVEAPTQLAPDGSGKVTASLSCSSGVDGDVEVSITATGADESVELTRSVPVTCQAPSRGVCDARSIPSDEQPADKVKSTDDGVSVVLDVTGGEQRNVAGDADIGGGLIASSDDDAVIKYAGSVSVQEFFRVEAADKVDLTVRNPEITNGPLQVDAGGNVTVDINGKGNAGIGGGQCVKAGGRATVDIKNQTIKGDLEIAGSSVDVTIKNTTVEGNLTVTVNASDEEDSDEDEGGGKGKGKGGKGNTGDGNSVSISRKSTIAGDFAVSGDEDISVSGCSEVDGRTPEACEGDD